MGNNKLVKTLCIAAFLGAISFSTQTAFADNVPTPTLDNLHNQDIINPATQDKDEQGNPIEGTGTVYPESAYTLTEIENADPENLPQNAITLYDKTEVIKYYDPQTGQEVAAGDRLPDVQYKEITTIQTTPKYYTVNLKDSVTNIGSGDTTVKYIWTKNSDGNFTLSETQQNADITATYDSKNSYINQTNTNGGAINNTSDNYGDIAKDFVGNVASDDKDNAKGGAIFNEGTIGNITGNFINNRTEGYIENRLFEAGGGAINNQGNIGDITGNFINNYSNTVGGAISMGSFTTGLGGISNIIKIGNINGNFIGNSAVQGGAIAIGGANETSIIQNITANFVGNHSVTMGGAIQIFAVKTGSIGKITGDFVGNYSAGNFSYGGAISNNMGLIDDITGDFIGNYASATGSYAYGGAIYSVYGDIGDITGDFIGNYVSSVEDEANGGAIYNDSTNIGNITGDFIGNYTKNGSGGAIYNADSKYYEIGDITGDFIGNTANDDKNIAKGGAIYNEGILGNITGNFINNRTEGYTGGTYYSVGGGAIYNLGTIGNITGNFINNYSNTNGGAISMGRFSTSGASTNESIAGDITGDFIGNEARYSGGAIALGSAGNKSVINNIIGNFIGNHSGRDGGAIYNSAFDSKIGNITGDFIGNYASGVGGSGGSIYNMSTIGDITGDFIGNYASSTDYEAYGGAIYNYGAIGNITGDFISNYASSSNSVAYGGAIYNNMGTIGKLDDDYNIIGGIYGSFINNYAKTESDTQLALGGAVYTRYDMNFIADNQTNYFSGNYTEDYRGKINNAIFVDTMSTYHTPTIKLQTQNNGVIVFDDQIDGGVSKQNSETGKYEIDRTNAYNLALTGDDTGAIYLNNKIINANISVDNTNVYVNEASNLAESRSLAVNSGILNIQHLNNQTINYESFSNNGTINLASVDVDLANESMGRITADTYGESNGTINVQGLNLLSDATKDTTSIQFADEQIAGSVSYTGATPIAYSPIWKYDVSYNPDDGFFTFSRGGSTSSSSAYNPAVIVSPVATQAGAYTTQLQTFNYAFQHVDTFMNIPYLERVAIINQNKYALSPTGDATDVGTYSPLMIKQHDPGFWVKPYASFENVPLKNGPKVSNINYGTLIGYDSPLTSISHGFERVLTGYIGYNGASQRYSGVDAYQNGGLLGGTATFYKGNFFNATTLSVGASAGDASTMYGSENYTMLLAGLGNKTGYNFEFFDGGMILQPSMLISYTFVNTFDYTNGAGVRIESDPMHAIQLAPGIKLIGNTKNGWQPYIGVSMVWNLLDESKVTADSVRLPEMSIKPYVQYGVGLQKRVNDKFLAFGQAMIHNGGSE